MGREKIFRFKQFAVLNDRTAMKVGTDGVLLGAWCPIEKVRHALDVGTGCGVIALMVAQRNEDAIIDAIDIDHNAIEEAAINFANSPWKDRLAAHQADFNALPAEIAARRYDLIVSNPPYFDNGVLPDGAARSQARHTQTLDYRQLIEGATQLLAEEGMLAIITPTDAEKTIIEASTFASLPVRQLTRVIPVTGAPPKRTLWVMSHAGMTYQENSITIADKSGAFTSEYVELTGAFYLKM